MIEITYQEAEALMGCRLDRRRKYAKREDEQPCEDSGSYAFQLVRFTHECTGCTEFGDYGTRYGGGGCAECGYTGKRRHVSWVPVVFEQCPERLREAA